MITLTEVRMTGYSLLSSGDRIADWRKILRTNLASYFSNRKLVAATLFAILFLFYFWPQNGVFGGRLSSSGDEVAQSCLASELASYEPSFNSPRLVYTRSEPPAEFEHPFTPFAGNGHIGLSIAPGSNQIHVNGGKALTVPTSIFPLITVQVPQYPFTDGYVVEYDKGKAKHIRCFNAYADNCVTVTSTVYAHRVYPNLLVQQIEIKNPLDHSIEIKLDRAVSTPSAKNRMAGNSEVEVVSLVASSSSIRQSSLQMVVSAAMQAYKSKATVKAKHTETLRFISNIDYEQFKSQAESESQITALEERVLKMYSTLEALKPSDLEHAHETVWKQLWLPSFTLSWSHAPNALNTDLINATRYGVLSNTPAWIHERNAQAPDQEPTAAEAARHALRQSELCYNAHHTLMYPSTLWSGVATPHELIATAYVWRLTLEKTGCEKLLTAGADGLSQAMLLSFGALKFTHHHLEFGTHPDDLHRDYAFKNVIFGEAAQLSYVNIWVEVGEDNRAQMFVSVTTNATNKPTSFYACDAGCLDQPVKLSAQRTALPVKLTEPLTPILYVADDREHLIDLKHTIHVREVADAPAHEHHVLALHRHGHRLGGLPTGFWIVLALLIITFHLFLFKLVYSEWMRTSSLPAGASAYRNRKWWMPQRFDSE